MLRCSVGEGWDDESFSDAVADTQSRLEQLAARLFGLRTADLLKGQCKATAQARFSGFLFGTEFAATRPYWLDQQPAIIGSEDVSKAYGTAPKQQGALIEIVDATARTLAGLV